MKILVIGPSWVGDMMMSQSLYRCLLKNQPDAQIDVMAPAWCRPLLGRMPEVRQALAMPVGHGSLALGERRRLGLALKAEQYQQALVLPNSFKSALVPFFAGIPIRTGWRGEMRYGVLNDRRTLDTSAFPLMVQRYAALAFPRDQVLSAEDLPAPLPWPRLRVDPQESHAARAAFGLDDAKPLVGFCPGAEFGPAKRWPHYHYAALAKTLIDQGYRIVLFGSQKDKPVGEEIRALLSPADQDHCRNLAGATSLDQAVSLIAGCRAMVTNDSGLMHVAAALDRPLVALYGPSSPDFTPPLSHRARVVRVISGYQRVRRGEGDQGYHQSLIDIQPERALAELDILFAADEGDGCGY
ncbi:ADP-heptose--LPS heptosyltransferase RfaF [Martelella alba]|uniref:lipopolysaccharide heptosyltransferase II n=1 Tax=Martelella alba TaxID=2590451 RepID=A0ABY2SGQ7_9HYPH|nr:ADP-heptose--LPS heptosyltransferase RfaF [Martelella alba]TKI04018.1 ADP-heptose--LPS heptosyltransferase RfaF [Martelella alba]